MNKRTWLRFLRLLAKKSQDFITFVAIFSLTLNYYIPLVRALTLTPQESDPEPTTVSVTATPEATEQVIQTPETTSVPIDPEIEPINTPAPTTNQSSSDMANSWIINSIGTEFTTKYSVQLNTLYDLPSNNNVAVRFTRLPASPGFIKIKELSLTNEQKIKLNAAGNVAYDITSDMADGTFTYELILPNPLGATNALEVKYAESLNELEINPRVVNPKIVDEQKVITENLDHFTVFVIALPITDGNDASIGSIAWSGTDQALVSDDSYATVALNGTDDISNYLTTSNFGFNIPATAVIEGITVEIEKNSTGIETIDTSVRLIRNGTLETMDFADQVIPWSNSDATTIYGGANELWGATWTAADINNSGFGVAISAQIPLAASDQTANVDSIVITVTYNTAPSVTLTTPNGGENLLGGSLQTITWVADDIDIPSDPGEIVTIDLSYSTDGITFIPIASGLPNTGSFSWSVPSIDSNSVLVRIKADDGQVFTEDDSDALFTIDSSVPTVDAGLDQLANAQFTQNGSAVDSESGIFSYQWSVDAGAPGLITFGSPNQPITTVVADTDGSYTIRLTATNNVDLSASSTFTLTWDTVAPNIPTVINPANNSYIQSSQVLRDWTDEVDTNGPVTYFYQHSTDPSTNPGDNSLVTIDLTSGILLASQFNVPTLSEGTYYWQVRACDAVSTGNCSNWSGPWQITVDDTAPVVDAGVDLLTNNAFDRTAFVTELNPFTVIWAAVGPGSISFTPADNETTNITADTDGIYTITVTVTDAAGNQSSDSFQLTWDTFAPNVPTLTSPAAGAFIQSSISLRDWSTEADLNSSVTYYYQHGQEPFVNPSDNSLTTVAFNSGVLSISEINVLALAEGTYYWQVRACDTVGTGNCSNWSGPWQINVDDTAPIVDAGTDVLASSAPFVQNGSVVDSSPISSILWTQQSGPGTVSFTPNDALSTQISVSSDGVYVIRLTITDAAGNSAFDEMVLTRDTVPPLTDLVTPANDSFYNIPIDITGNSLDDLAVALVLLEYRPATDPLDLVSGWLPLTQFNNIPASTPFNWNFAWTPPAEGAYDLRAHAVDSAGNIETTDYAFNITYDITTPVVPSLIAPNNGAIIHPSLATLDWTDVVDNLTNITYSFQLALNSAVGANNALINPIIVNSGLNLSEFDASASADNVYYWQVRACDAAGNCSNWSGPWQVTIDGSNPTVDAGSDKLTRITVLQDASASDAPAGIATYQWSQISGPGTVIFGSPNSEDTTLTANADGIYILRLTVTDNSGNSAFDEMQLTWDATPPTAPTWVPFGGNGNINGITKQTNSIIFRWNAANDATTIITGYEYEIIGPSGYLINSRNSCGGQLILPTDPQGLQVPNSLIGPTGTCLIGPYVELPFEGSYTRRIRAYDTAGNISAWSESTILRDTIRPTSFITGIVSPSQQFNGTYFTNANRPSFSVNASDIGSGVKQVTIYTTILLVEVPVGTCSNLANCTVPNLPNTLADGLYSFYSKAEDFADDLAPTDSYLPGGGGDIDNGGNQVGNRELKNLPVTPEIRVMIDTMSPDADIFSIVSVAPSSGINYTAPVPDNIILKGNVRITGSVFDANLWRYFFLVHNSSNVQVAGPVPATVDHNGPTVNPFFDWNTTLVPDGNYTIKIEARDKANNKLCGNVQCDTLPAVVDFNDPNDSVDWITLTVDNTPPTTNVAIVGNLDPAGDYPPLQINGNAGWNGFGWYDNFATVRLEIATGNTGTDTIKYQTVGQSIACPAIGSPSYLTAPHNTDIAGVINALGNGVHKLCYYGVDLINNVEPGAPKNILLRIDNTNPSFNITNVTGNLVSGTYYQSTNAMSVTINVTDTFSGYRKARYDLYNNTCTGSPTVNEDNVSGPGLLSATRVLMLNNLAQGSYCLRIWVYDDVQNKSATQDVLFVIDTTPPVPPVWEQSPIFTRYNSLGGNQNVPLNFIESPDSDISRYEYQSVTVNLDNTNKVTNLINPAPSVCNISNTTQETCIWSIATQPDTRWIYRLRAIDLAGNMSLWTNWNLSTVNDISEFEAFVGEDFEYRDYINKTGVFSVVNYDATETQGFAIREDNDPKSEIASVVTITNTFPVSPVPPAQPVVIYTNEPLVTVNYLTNDADTGLKNVTLWYSFNNGTFQQFITDTYNGEIDPTGSFTFNFPNNLGIPESDGDFCFYTLSEDIADDLVVDNLLGNEENVKPCQVRVILDRNRPFVDPKPADPLPYIEGQFLPALNAVGNDTLPDKVNELCMTITIGSSSGAIFNNVDNICRPNNGNSVWNLLDATVWFGQFIGQFDTTLIDEGDYYISYYVTDLAGNRSDADPNTIPDPIDPSTLENYLNVITINNVPPFPISLRNENPEPIFEGDVALFSGGFADPSCLPFGVTPCADSIPTDNIGPMDDSPWTATINYGDGTVLSLGTFKEPGDIVVPGHIYENEGIYTVTLTVTENSTGKGEGQSGSNSIQVAVNNAPPIVIITATPGANVLVGTSVTLSARGRFGNEPYSFLWSGACSGTDSVFVLPSQAGLYECTVTLTDIDGDSTSATIAVAVNNPQQFIVTRTTQTNEDEVILGENENLLQLCEEKFQVSGFVFNDDNNNGSLDPGELGVKDILVRILATIDNEEVRIVTLTTLADGSYEFNLCPGDYRVEVVEDSVTGGLNLPNGNIFNITVTQGENLDNINFPMTQNNGGFNWAICLIPLGLLGLLVLIIWLASKRRQGYQLETR